ncbi:MAG: recombinase family protein [Clostridia bacterium]|nr:recombinase family protein [Clostridia bacterium]
MTKIPATERPVVYVAAYCRVSTDLEEQEGSLEAQVAHWTEFVTTHGPAWSLVGVYSEQGLSATHAETRPVLMELLGHCREGRVNLILTKSISRFSRNTIDCLSLVRALKVLGVAIIFEKENIDTGSMTSELFLTLLASFAAEESRNISRNVHMGYTHRFQTGTYKYVRPPYGYSVVDGQLIPDKGEAEIVRDIFDMAISGQGPTAIAETLQRRGVATKYNATWMGNTVTAILGNITYTGDSLWQKTFRDADYKQEKNDGQLNRYYLPDHHEALVSREVFVLANQAMGYGDPYASLGIVPPSLLEQGEEQREVTVIKAKPKVELVGVGKLRVAAYCRVSTDLEDQEGSYEAQCSHYRTLIQSKSDWSLAGIYADEGLSGTCRTKREQFNRMVEDAEKGRIDLILTKSISRFARNTLDCLTVVRKLKALGIGITFEKEGLDTLDGTGEVILTILASIAQQESASISQNVRIGIQYRFQRGIPMVNCSRFLGYDKRDGKLVINEVQAGVVRRIYRDYLDGYSMDMISYDLRREGVTSGSGNTAWPVSSVKYVLLNEKYAGDLLLQKFFVEDFLTHKTVRNRGQLPQYFVSQAHAPIVPRCIFDRVADEIFLRGCEAGKGGKHYGSRNALKGRTICGCGGKMTRLRRKEDAVYKCSACAYEVPEAELRRQVMAAFQVLPARRDEIEAKLDTLETELKSNNRKTRAAAQRQEWRLRNLLPQDQGMMTYCAACYDEGDFRARTGKQTGEWSDSAMGRVLVKVVAGESVEFNGGVVVDTPTVE